MLILPNSVLLHLIPIVFESIGTSHDFANDTMESIFKDKATRSYSTIQFRTAVDANNTIEVQSFTVNPLLLFDHVRNEYC